MQIKFYKVATLPTSLEPNSFYYVERGKYTEAYLTNNAGIAKNVGNTSMINDLVSKALGNWGGSSEVSISKVEYNRLEAKPDGLYVRDRLDPDPLAYYILARG